MQVKTKPRSPFGELLREILDEKNITIRELCRRMTPTGDFTEAESRRRMIQRYLRGDIVPSERVRNEIADVLDEPRDRLAEDRERERELRVVHDSLLPLADALLGVARDMRERAAQ